MSAPVPNTNQKKNITKTVIILLAIMAVFMVLFLHKMLSPRILNHQQLLANGAVEFNKPRIIPPFSLVDDTNHAFTLEQLKDHWTVVYFGFTSCPDICPTTLAMLSKWYSSLDQAVQDKTQVVMISVDPGRDTVALLHDYMAHFNDDFIGVTGDLRDIRILADQLNVTFQRASADENYSVDHSGHLVLINPYGHYHGLFKPPFDMARLKLTYLSMVTMFD